MKLGWDAKRLGDVICLEYGKPLYPADRNQNGRYPVYGANGEKDRTDKFFRDKPRIIVGRKGSAGELTLTEDKFWPLDVTYFVEFDREHYDLQFLYYLLSTLDIPSLAKGVKPGINRNEVYALPVRIPPFPEQYRIVAILDDAFDGIATAKANAEKNLQNARALFESHLQAVFSQRGEGWVEKSLGDLCDLISGQHIDAKDYNADRKGIGYLTGPSDFGSMNPIITKWTEHPKRVARAGDILITVKGSGVGKINILNSDNVAISRQLMAVRVKNVEMEFIYALLSTKFDYFQLLSNGAAIPGISREDVLASKCLVPSSDEQKAIVEEIDILAGETQHLESIY